MDPRDDAYERIIETAHAARGGSRLSAMHAVVDALWDAFGSNGCPAPDRLGRPAWSWIGFYYAPGAAPPDAGRPAPNQMLLGPRRDKPACSPIGLHGACGRALLENAALIVDDVASLGEGYIACDPKDVSEIVVPLTSGGGRCWGVLDADSFAPRAFGAHDAAALRRVLLAAGLTDEGAAPVVRRL